MATRLADAMRRGALASDRQRDDDSVDFFKVDWFDLADRPVTEARHRFSLTPKADQARRAGSVGPWEPGGISPFQVNAGRTLAESEDRPYDSYGAEPNP